MRWRGVLAWAGREAFGVAVLGAGAGRGKGCEITVE